MRRSLYCHRAHKFPPFSQLRLTLKRSAPLRKSLSVLARSCSSQESRRRASGEREPRPAAAAAAAARTECHISIAESLVRGWYRERVNISITRNIRGTAYDVDGSRRCAARLCSKPTNYVSETAAAAEAAVARRARLEFDDVYVTACSREPRHSVVSQLTERISRQFWHSVRELCSGLIAAGSSFAGVSESVSDSASLFHCPTLRDSPAGTL